MSQNLVSDMSRSTFEIGAAQLRSATEIARKHRSYVRTKAPTGVIFKAAQNLSGIVLT